MQKIQQEQKKRRGLKVVSVILSVLLWFYVVNQGELTAGQNSVEVELQYYNVPSGVKVAGPDQVSVRLWGVLQKTGKIIAYVDLKGLEEGTYQLPVKVEPVAGALFTSVQPKKVEVVLQTLQEHIVPVNYLITRNPPEGYDLLDIVMTPEKCLVKGEEDALGKVTAVVARVDLGNVRSINSLKVKLLARDVEGKMVSEGITIIPETVTVYAVVSEKKGSKEIPVTAITSGEVAPEFELSEITAEPAAVLVLGNDTVLQLVDEIETVPIDISDRNESFNEQVNLVVPEGCKVYPQTVMVQVDIARTPGLEEDNGD